MLRQIKEAFAVRNFQRELDKLIEQAAGDGVTPSLLLHSCCAPCSSYCLSYLSEYFSITLLYYNPNIYPEEEYFKRVKEQKRLISEMKFKNPVSFIEGRFDPQEFYSAVKGLEKCKEGSERCFKCYELRLREAAEYAKKGSFDYFTTTLSISPLKNAAKINEIGEKIAVEYGVKHLPSDFKKKEGYKKSTLLSKEYGLYRQNYCGCVFSQSKD
ncbi:MAG: epoxyqueuosine reductase QueH [Clostridia bacterium]|nr:epoxyqueuosine reductase QueH [Clostridia bacterium]